MSSLRIWDPLWRPYVPLEEASRTIPGRWVYVTLHDHPDVYAFVYGHGLVFFDYKDSERQTDISGGSFSRRFKDCGKALAWLSSLGPDQIGPEAEAVIAHRRRDIEMAKAFQGKEISADEYRTRVTSRKRFNPPPLPLDSAA